MKVYILASHDNYSFAESLLKDMGNVKVISKLSSNEEISESISLFLKMKIETVDVFLAIIDEKFTENASLNAELQLALLSVKENRNRMLIPVILNEAVIPTALDGMLYIKCNSKTEKDLSGVKQNIEKVLSHYRRNRVRRKSLIESNSRTSSMIIMTIAIELFAMLFVVLLFKEKSFRLDYIGDEDIITMSIGIIAVTLAFATLFTSYLSIMKRRWKEDDEEEIEAYSRRLKRAIAPEEMKQDAPKASGNEDKKKEIDALGRMMINLEDIKEFYTWSQKQAKASFVLAVSMCISGFVLMIIAIVLPMVFSLSFQMSIIPAIGGVITELVAGTALVVYRNSLAQLNHYHKALHEDERFLSSVNLLGKFSTTEAQDEMLREIIRSEIQMNLSGIKEDKKTEQNKEEKSK